MEPFTVFTRDGSHAFRGEGKKKKKKKKKKFPNGNAENEVSRTC